MGKRAGFTRIELIVVVCILFVLLEMVGVYVPRAFLFNLAFGWAFYLYRVLPQVHVRISGVLTAILCLSALAVGLHRFLHWLAGQRSANADSTDVIRLTWPARRTVVILTLVVVMFVAGISAVGVSHQIGWLITSPESIIEGRSQAQARNHSENNLKQMALAMLNYREIEQALPSAAIYDRQGRPLLSWRVAILPYVEEGQLYKEFHLDEPWDSPHNLRLLPQMPKIYAPVGEDWNVKPHSTPYQVFVGKGTAFDGKRGLRISNDFPDGTSNTILIAEAAELVPWTKPAELHFDQRPVMPALHRWSTMKVSLLAMADSSVRTISQSMKESTLRAAITRNGGETLGPDW